MVGAQALERAADLVTRRARFPQPRLRREEEPVAFALHPRSEAKLGVVVVGGHVHVVDPVGDHRLHQAIGFPLRHAPERERSEDGAATGVPGTTER